MALNRSTVNTTPSTTPTAPTAMTTPGISAELPLECVVLVPPCVEVVDVLACVAVGAGDEDAAAVVRCGSDDDCVDVALVALSNAISTGVTLPGLTITSRLNSRRSVAFATMVSEPALTTYGTPENAGLSRFPLIVTTVPSGSGEGTATVTRPTCGSDAVTML